VEELRSLIADPGEFAHAFLSDLEEEFEPGEAILRAEAAIREKLESGRDPYWEKALEAIHGILEGDEPEALAYFSDGGELGDPQAPHEIGRYRRDTGDFVAEWHQTDSWRGYAIVRPVERSRWVQIMDDGILRGSADAEQLEAFDELLQGFLTKHGIRHARVFGATSNLFWTTYALFVEREYASKILAVLEVLEPLFRDSERYEFTALTGLDPDDPEVTAADRLFVRIGKALLQGESDSRRR
jgi:hypothetical protein